MIENQMTITLYHSISLFFRFVLLDMAPSESCMILQSQKWWWIHPCSRTVIQQHVEHFSNLSEAMALHPFIQVIIWAVPRLCAWARVVPDYWWTRIMLYVCTKIRPIKVDFANFVILNPELCPRNRQMNFRYRLLPKSRQQHMNRKFPR